MKAHYAYKKAKEEYAIVLAEKFKEVITVPAYMKTSQLQVSQIYPTPAHNCGD